MLLFRKKTVESESVEDLKDKKVGAQMGSIQEEKGKELAEEIGINL